MVRSLAGERAMPKEHYASILPIALVTAVGRPLSTGSLSKADLPELEFEDCSSQINLEVLVQLARKRAKDLSLDNEKWAIEDERSMKNGKRSAPHRSPIYGHEKGKLRKYASDDLLPIIHTACRFEVLAREHDDVQLVAELSSVMASCRSEDMTLIDCIYELECESLSRSSEDADMLLRDRLTVRNQARQVVVSLPIVQTDAITSPTLSHRLTNGLWLRSLVLVSGNMASQSGSTNQATPVVYSMSLSVVSDGVLGPHASRPDVLALELRIDVYLDRKLLPTAYTFTSVHAADHLDRVLRFAFPNDADEAVIRSKTGLDAGMVYQALRSSILPANDSLQPRDLEAALFPFQKRSVNFLLGREGKAMIGKDEDGSPTLRDLDGIMSCEGIVDVGLFWRPLSEDIYYNPFSGAITSDKSITHRDVVKGGILAEEMGLGKTVEIFALILLHPDPARSLQPSYFDERLDVEVWPTKTTLIVAPEVLRQQWLDEAALHAPRLRTFNYYGYKQAAQKIPNGMAWSEFARSFDIIVVSFDTLRQEVNVARKAPNRSRRFERKYERPRSLLIQLAFHRVVMDEVQLVGHSMAAETVSMIAREFSVAVSGTPIKQLSDLQSLFTFLRMPGPIASKAHWNRLLQPHLIPILTNALGVLATRHTKAQVRHEMLLPQQTRILVPVTFTAIESAFYRDIKQRLLTSAGIDPSSFADDQQLVRYVRDRFSGDAAQLRSTLLALRQACTHPQVVGSGMRGTALAASQTIRSIDEVLTIMVEGAKSEADTLWYSLVQKRIDRAVLLLQRKEYDGRHEIAKLMLTSALDDVHKRQANLKSDIERAQIVGPLYRFDSVAEREAASKSDASQARSSALALDVQPKTPAEREKEHIIAEKALLRRRHLNALQLRLRNYLEQEHRCHCFLGNIFFQLGDLAKEKLQSNGEKVGVYDAVANAHEPALGEEAEAVAVDLKKAENQAYDAAESVRQELLKETRKNVEQAIESVHDSSIDFTFDDVQSLMDAGEGGLRSAVQFDRLQDMQRLLNKHAEVLFDWREKIWQRLQKPVNRLVSDEDENDDQYAENLDAQAEAEALLEMYRVLINEREYMLTGVRIEGTLSRPQLYTQLEREVPQHERALKRSELRATAAPEFRRHDASLEDWLPSEQEVVVMRQQLDHFRTLEQQLRKVAISPDSRAALDSSRTRRRRLSDAAQDSVQAGSVDEEERIITVDLVPLDALQRELREIQQNTDRSEEVAIVRGGLEVIRQIQAKQRQMIERLKKESLSFSAVWNARAAYFKQIQDISDQVRDIVTTDIADKTANLEREEATLKRREEVNAGRLRYLQAIEEEEGVDGDGGDTANSDSTPKTCPICTEQLFRAVVLDVCGHTTCENCFRHWTVQHRRCPMCKAGVNVSNVYRVTYGSKGKKLNVLHPETDADLRRKTMFNVIDDERLQVIQRQPLRSTLGSKLDLLTRHLLNIEMEKEGTKTLIFTAFARGISLVGDALRLNGIKFVTLDQGGARGGAIIDTFKNDKAINVLLLHSEAQSSGLNLVCARNIFLLEPLVNHALELQAIGRVHRIGQTKETNVFCYQVSDTVEQRIIEMARKRHQSLFTLDNCVSSDLKDSAELVAKVQQTKGLARSNHGLRDGEFVGQVDEMISCLFPDVDEDRQGQLREGQTGPSVNSSGSGRESATGMNERERMRQERLAALERRHGQL